ncbi:hypothetical protein F5Y18DRAFT_367142 [Xylariaceae sp. FL1019]|nr:hypothetical protein F5Y18DRAFT_367142 [Xylariaceae sp. FL1019]
MSSVPPETASMTFVSDPPDLAIEDQTGQLPPGEGTQIHSDDENRDDRAVGPDSTKNLQEDENDPDLVAARTLDTAIRHDDDRTVPQETYVQATLKGKSIMHDGVAKQRLKLETREGILSKRFSQAVIYTAFTEMRIAGLEEELRKMKIALYKLPENFDATKPRKRHPSYLHDLRRSSPAAFEMKKHYLNIPIKDRPALEALTITDVKIPADQAVPGSPHRRPTAMNDTQPGEFQSPERLRIRSRPLLAHIQQVTRTQESFNIEAPEEPEIEPNTVFLRPFKLFVTHEIELRDSLPILEADMSQKADLDPGYDEKTPKPRRRQVDKKDFDPQDLLLDLKLLIKFMNEDMKPVFDLRREIADGTATAIHFGDLWHLFRRGDIVISSGSPHAYRVMNFTGGRDPLIDRIKGEEPEPVDGFVVDCLFIQCDGVNYVPQLQSISIRPYIGKRVITSLPIFPLRLAPNSEALRRRFTAQGRQFLDLTTPSFMHKHLLGKTLDEPPHDIDAQVIVDMTMALNVMAQWRPTKYKTTQDGFTRSDSRETRISPWCHHSNEYEGCCGSDVGSKDLEMDKINLTRFMQDSHSLLGPRTAQELGEEDLMLLPHKVHGFILRNRQWITCRTADLSPVLFDSGFDKLILPDRHKFAVQALVKVHENARSDGAAKSSSVGTSIDLVKGKGTGLIILLHGAPGVGKTSTAECVADDTCRPLFPVTCGDIGETAMEVEKNLHHNFRLAHKWGCVLLLDEADVFLAKRNKMDLRRNAVTSVFLRSLEYYAGILFLTTNRVGSIDLAFKSRIHISLYYPKLDYAATRQLYKTYIQRTRMEQERANSATFDIRDKEILRFAKIHFRELEKEGFDTWNGRQIRNAFQAAIALVDFKGQQAKESDKKPVLGEEQFRVVADSSKEFDMYLRSTLGAGESDIARQEQLRFDRFGHLDPPRASSSHRYDTKKSTYGETTSRTEQRYTDSDDDDTSDDSSSDDGPGQKRSVKKGKEAGRDKDDEGDSKDYDEFREFMKWKNRK